MQIAIMLEGQNGLNWPRWQRIAQLVEQAGFAGLYRSDHFTNARPPELDSLELWISLTWLASHTQRISFGQLVSPVSFRDPVMLARMALQLDDLSGGRLTLGMGAGWQEREHTMFGYELLAIPERFQRFEESLEVVTRLMLSETPVSFSGKYYNLQEAVLLPRPQRPGGPPLLVGGNGERRTLPLAARYADEWNAVYLTPARFRELNGRLNELLRQQGRGTDSVRRSMMTGIMFGRDQESLQRKLNGRDPDELRARGVIVGAGAEIRPQLEELAAAGLQAIMLQWLDLDDLAGLEALAGVVL